MVVVLLLLPSAAALCHPSFRLHRSPSKGQRLRPHTAITKPQRNPTPDRPPQGPIGELLGEPDAFYLKVRSRRLVQSVSVCRCLSASV